MRTTITSLKTQLVDFNTLFYPFSCNKKFPDNLYVVLLQSRLFHHFKKGRHRIDDTKEIQKYGFA